MILPPRARPLSHVALGIVLAGCAVTAPPATTTSPIATRSETVTISPNATPSETATVFPTAAFAAISEAAVSEEDAAALQAILDAAIPEAVGAGGITATVMTASGTWSGATGTADGIRDMRPDDQMAVGSITKSVVAAQVMQLVEAGELALDDPASDYLPADLDFDTNKATIRHLLSMRSGIPDYVDALWPSLSTDRTRVWTLDDVLALVPDDRAPAGETLAYSSTNYVLLGLIIEHVRGRALAAVLRDGVLSGNGLERLAYQPDEPPTEPLAMPGGTSTAALEEGGGFLPSLAGATAAGPAGAIASDSASLARWWSRLCGGEIVSQASLDQMTTFHGWYGMGLDGRVDTPGTPAVGHGGIHVGYAAWAVCLVEDGSVVVVLTNREAGGTADGDVSIAIDVAAALAAATRSD